ncbi:MAG: hypothetical protein WDW36_010049 [Sanguina aurantia]
MLRGQRAAQRTALGGSAAAGGRMTQQAAFHEDNYTQQLGELLALQSTVNEGDFRVWRERGMPTDGSSSSGSSSSSSSAPTCDTLHLESLLESGESPCPEDQGRPLWCEVLVHVEVPASGIQLLLQFPDPGTASKGAASCPDSTAAAASAPQAAAAHAPSPPSGTRPGGCDSVAGVGDRDRGAGQAQRGSRDRSQRSQRSQQGAGSSSGLQHPGSSAHSSSPPAGMQAVSAAPSPPASSQAAPRAAPPGLSPFSATFRPAGNASEAGPRSSHLAHQASDSRQQSVHGQTGVSAPQPVSQSQASRQPRPAPAQQPPQSGGHQRPVPPRPPPQQQQAQQQQHHQQRQPMLQQQQQQARQSQQQQQQQQQRQQQQRHETNAQHPTPPPPPHFSQTSQPLSQNSPYSTPTETTPAASRRSGNRNSSSRPASDTPSPSNQHHASPDHQTPNSSSNSSSIQSPNNSSSTSSSIQSPNSNSSTSSSNPNHSHPDQHPAGKHNPGSPSASASTANRIPSAHPSEVHNAQGRAAGRTSARGQSRANSSSSTLPPPPPASPPSADSASPLSADSAAPLSADSAAPPSADPASPRARTQPTGSPPTPAPVPGPVTAAVSAVVPGPVPAPRAGHPSAVAVGPAVQHLPPITLTVCLPAGYPSHEAPHVQLQALWLGAQQLQLLTAALLRQWAGQGPGSPIVYTWLDWLQSCALSELAVSDTLVLSPQHEQVEPRSSGSSVTTAAATSAAAASAPEPRAQSAEQVAGQVLRYCSRREAQVFARANQSCCICMEEYLGSSCLRLECEHHFCRGCLSQHCRTQLEEGAVDNLRCPQPKCRLALSPCALQQMLTAAELERFEALVLQRTLNAMQDIVYCPRAGCQTVCIEDGDHLAQCPTCFFAFCSLCGESWHAGTQCMDPATALEILAKRNQRGGGENRIADARKELDLLNQMKSLKLMAETTRRCPMCDMGIDKSEGCNKMTCLSCGTFFCWKCLSIIEGYDHFGRDSCSMFDLEEIQRWNAQMQEHAPPREAVAEARHMVGLMRDLGARPCFCPRCGQQNVKEGGNNDVRCWACSSHFCYLCRSAFAKSGAHFRAGGCKQHTL